MTARGLSAVLYWPEFSTFLKKSGVSIAVELPFTLGPRGRWSFGIERNIIGMSQGKDMTRECAATLNNLKVSGKFIQNGSFTEVRIQHLVTKSVSMVAQMFMTKGTSPIGERPSFGARRGGHFGLQLGF